MLISFDEFRMSLAYDSPPLGLSEPLVALWYDSKGDWHRAHQTAQELNDATGAWVHAYLHRKEGDLANAAYWYSRAGKPQPKLSLDAEWEQIVKALLPAPV